MKNKVVNDRNQPDNAWEFVGWGNSERIDDLLGFFALLNLIGIGESAVVALVIFVFHLITLTILCGTSVVMIVSDPSLLNVNMTVPTPGGLQHALFFGFAAAMLGISGFESSANFIEELAKRLGVPKNYMFIGTPGDRFPHKIETLGGVRLIL